MTDAQTSRIMRKLIGAVEKELKKKELYDYGVSLFVFPLNRSDGHVNYISSVKREDAQKALKFILDRWDANEPDTPLHKRH